MVIYSMFVLTGELTVMIMSCLIRKLSYKYEGAVSIHRG